MQSVKLENFRRVRELKRLCVNLCGGTCSQCGLKDDDIEVYDFHHIGAKNREISELVSVHARRRTPIDPIPQDIRDELAKCLLVCSNCHRKITHKEKARSISKGLFHAKFKGRPPNIDRLKLMYELHTNGVGGTTLAKQFKCSRSAIYANLKRAQEYIECGAADSPQTTTHTP